MLLVENGLALGYDIAKIFAILYGLVCISVLVYGIYSFINSSSRIYKDEESSYKASLPLSIVRSIKNKSLEIFYWHRIIPKENIQVRGSVGRLMGLIYILIALLMLAPLVWAYFKLR